MDLFEALADRRSIRRFKPDPVPSDDIKKIVELATLAPNGSNIQPWHFIALTDKKKITDIRKIVDEKLVALTGREKDKRVGRSYFNFFGWAPAVILVFQTPYPSHTDEMIRDRAPEVVKDRRIIINSGLQSVAAAITCLTLTAHALGYATCWMTAPLIARKEIQSYLDTPDDHMLIAMLPLGKPAAKAARVPRKPVDKVLDIL